MAATPSFGLNGTTVTLSATTTSSNAALAVGGNSSVMVTSAGTGTAFIRSGVGSGTVALVTDTPILSGTAQTFSIPADHTYVAAITASGTATVYVTIGSGQ